MALQGERKAATVTQWEAGGIWLPPNAVGLPPISWTQAWSQLPKSRCCFLCSTRVEGSYIQPACNNTLDVMVVCLLLSHSPGMCHLHPLAHIPFLFASCLKRKPAQIWLKNLADASRQQGPECYFCLVQGITTDRGVWCEDHVCSPSSDQLTWRLGHATVPNMPGTCILARSAPRNLADIS